jgi:glycosyltransferase involved in cell wall biosynthesis
MKKIIFVTNIPNPYRVPLFNEMSRLFRENGFILKVVFGAESYVRRNFKLDKTTFNFDYHILKDEAITFSEDGEKSYFRYKGLNRLLNIEKPDLLIVTGFSLATMKAFARRISTGTPYIIYGGSLEQRNNSLLRKIQRKLLIRFAAGFVVYGNRAKDNLLNNGAEPGDIFIAINTVDTEFFSTKTQQIRKDLPADKLITFTYLGYLVPRKNVQLLLESIKILAETKSGFMLDIIGDGTSLPDLKRYVAENKLDSLVTFHGFQQKEQLPHYFAKSNGFLFQTDFDIWGLVLNEAMAAAVPCLASPNAGATYDLIREGETGFVVDFNNKNLVVEKLCWLIENPGDAKRMGEKAAAYINAEVNLQKSASGFLNAVNHVLNKKNRSLPVEH